MARLPLTFPCPALHAAALPQVSNLNDMLQRLEQGQKQLLALAGNERARRLNHRSVNSPGHAVLQRLRRESEATAGSPALGDLPSQGGPQGIFPADTQALSKVGVVRPCRLAQRWQARRIPLHTHTTSPLQLKNPQINALERFYDVQFQGDSGGCCFAGVGAAVQRIGGKRRKCNHLVAAAPSLPRVPTVPLFPTTTTLPTCGGAVEDRRKTFQDFICHD